MIQYKVKNEVNPIRAEDAKILGSISEQMNIFFENRVKSDFAKNVIYKETEDAFREQRDDETAVGYWKGEFWGKWIISACRVYRYTKDEALRDFVHKGALTLLSLARNDGYIGTYKDSANVLAADVEKTRQLMGWNCNWNWNVWCRKYTLWGLLEVYGITNDDKILRGAEKFALQLISELRDLGLSFCDVGTFNGIPASSILKPLLILYRYTENKEFLDAALKIADDFEKPDGHIPNIIANALKGIPVHQWYSNSQNWAKAYETMSFVDGLIELYRITGVEKYFTASKNMYELLKKHEGNRLFSVGFNDIFANAERYINCATEPCDVIHWMRICYELFTLTGEEKYMDTFELAFLNPFLAASFADGKWGARAVRSAGRHQVSHNQAGMKYSHCCVNNMPRGYINAVEAFAMASEDAVYVNMFTQYTGILNTSFGRVKIDIGGSYLEDGKVKLSLDSENDFKLKIRIPQRSEKTIISFEGRDFYPKSGEYFELCLNKGENTVCIAFDTNPSVVDFPHEVEIYPDNDFRINRWYTGNDINPDYARKCKSSAVLYGPLLLTRSLMCGNTHDEMFSDKTICGKGFKCFVSPMKPTKTRCLFKVKLDNGKESFETTMCDFATGSNYESENQDGLFNIWM